MSAGEWAMFALALGLMLGAWHVGNALAGLYERMARRHEQRRDDAYRRLLEGRWSK